MLAKPSNVLFAQAEALKQYMAGASQIVAAVEYQPDRQDWSGDLSDATGVSSAFSREELDEIVDKVTKATDSGNLCDINLSVLQASMLACMERAFRTRNSSIIRRRVHTAGVQAGHGNDAGIWSRGLDYYIDGIRKLGNKSSAGATT
jgi:hypothetical protein